MRVNIFVVKFYIFLSCAVLGKYLLHVFQDGKGGRGRGRCGKGGKSPPAPRPKPPGNDNLMWHHLSIIQASFGHHSKQQIV